MAVKLDMSKYYDRVEWAFVENMLKALGFQEKWIKIVISCITTVNYLVLVNGKRKKQFSPIRELR